MHVYTYVFSKMTHIMFDQYYKLILENFITVSVIYGAMYENYLLKISLYSDLQEKTI